ncbi:MAG: peroxiredoxin [Candidatus Zixiibacteriota bacterium]|nr:MAG: peroxiredoxin [candidate division Zixibacteria bacterium]
MPKARVKWIEDKTFLGTDANGKAVVLSDSAGPGVGPMQMLLLGLGGCSLIDVVIVLQKQRQDFVDVEVEIDGTRGEEFPKAWTDIHMHYIVSGRELDEAKVERAIQLSIEKYCGAYATLSGVANITHDFEVRQAE